MTKLKPPAPLGLPGIPFGYDKNPYSRWNTHRGDDWKWKLLSPVKSKKVTASAAGKVVELYSGDLNNRGYGRRVVIQHPTEDGSIVRTTYNHLAKNTIKVRMGQLVATDHHLGTMGNSGDAKGVHLHRELTINGVRVNARTYHNKDIPGTPLTGSVRRVRSDIKSLNGRERPTTESDTEGNALTPGEKYRFYYWTRGQNVSVGSGKNKVTSDIWFQGKTGRWFAAAGFTTRSTVGLIKK